MRQIRQVNNRYTSFKSKLLTESTALLGGVTSVAFNFSFSIDCIHYEKSRNLLLTDLSIIPPLSRNISHDHRYLKLSAQRNETETKQFQNSLETVLFQFHFNFAYSFIPQPVHCHD